MYEKAELVRELDSRLRAQERLLDFARQAWPLYAGSASKFIDGFHFGALCEHLEACYRREIRKLIIALPVRCAKSSFLSVIFQPWVWTHSPHESFLYATRSEDLSFRDAVRSRWIIESEWYQSRWGEKFKIYSDQNNKKRYMNTEKGYRLSLSVNSGSTGDGGNFRIIDDPIDANDVTSPVLRTGVNEWYSQAFSTRTNDPKSTVDIISMQRLDHEDLIAYVLSGKNSKKWIQFVLPMEFEKARRCITVPLPSTNGKPWQDPRTEEGELLWPNRFGPEEVEDLKNDLKTPQRVAAQLQLNPSPAEGGIFKKDDFRVWKKTRPPTLAHIIQSWDTAYSGEKKGAEVDSSFSACGTWGLFYDENSQGNLILLSLWRKRVEFRDLKYHAKLFYQDYRHNGDNTGDIIVDGRHRPDIVLVEAKASGLSLITELEYAGLPVHRFDPKSRFGDKTNRARIFSNYVKAGRVWVVAKGPDFKFLRESSEMLVNFSAMFPESNESRDVVDEMVQVIALMVSSGWITDPADKQPKPSRSYHEELLNDDDD